MTRVDFLLELGRMRIPVADVTGVELDEELQNA